MLLLPLDSGAEKTDPLPFDAATEDLLASLKQLDTVGEMVVVRDSESMTSNSWTITFTPDPRR